MSTVDGSVSYGITLTAAGGSNTGPDRTNPLTVTRTGTIAPGDTIGVYGSAGYTPGWAIVDSGIITGSKYGISIAGVGTINNTGFISDIFVQSGVVINNFFVPQPSLFTYPNNGTLSSIVMGSGTVINAAVVEGSGTAIAIGGVGTVVNLYTVLGLQEGISVGSGSVSNFGTLTVLGTYGVDIGISLGSGTVTNNGYVFDGGESIGVGAGVGLSLGSGTVINYGLVAVAGTAGAGISVSGFGTVNNSGTVSIGIYPAQYGQKLGVGDGIGIGIGSGTVSNNGVVEGAAVGISITGSGTVIEYGGRATGGTASTSAAPEG